MTEKHEVLSTMVAGARLESMMGSGRIGPLISSNFNWAAALRKATLEEDWQEVGRLGAQCLGWGYATFRLLQSEAIAESQRQRNAEASSKAFVELLRAQAKSDHRAEFFAQLRDKLDQRRPDRLIKWQESLQMLERGQTREVPLLKALAHLTPPSDAPGRQAAEDATIMGLSRGLHGLLHAEFNLAFQARKAEDESLLEADLTGALKAAVGRFGELLRSGQQHLHTTLLANRSVEDTVQAATSLAGLIEYQLPGFARAQALAALATRALRSRQKDGAPEELGRMAMQAGALTREAVASHAASYLLAMALLAPESRKEVELVWKEDSALPFDVSLPRGQSIPLHMLDRVEEGEFIEVEGFALALQVEIPSDGMPLTRVELIDPSSGARAVIVAVKNQLANLGVTKGAFCRINGIYRRKSKLYEQKPAIEVDFLPLGMLASQSWRIAFLISVDRWFRCWSSSGTNMYWSLGPHRRPRTGNELGYYGAGELIYRPFVRK